jgi:hypothetical protein
MYLSDARALAVPTAFHSTQMPLNAHKTLPRKHKDKEKPKPKPTFLLPMVSPVYSHW